MSTAVAIHQPNFFPWLGYFNKIACADVFVFLDNVQFVKTGGSWTNRVQLKIDGERRWVTIPVTRNYHGLRTIRETRIASAWWRTKLVRTLKASYGRARHFAEVFPFLEQLINNPSDELADYNISAIVLLAGRLGLPRTQYVLASDFNVRGQATDLLVALVQAVGGTTYLCGGGAAGYQQDHKFHDANIEVRYQSFAHPIYPQSGPAFLSGLSIIDALMHCGFDGVRALASESHDSSASATRTLATCQANSGRPPFRVDENVGRRRELD